MVDGITTEYFSINREIPQGSVQGPILFSIMINDIIPVYSHNQIVKFADDITLNIKVDQTRNTSDIEIKNVMDWVTYDNQQNLVKDPRYYIADNPCN